MVAEPVCRCLLPFLPGLEFVPGAALFYYFNNNQPVSYRTENMTLIGVGAGVRFEF